MEEVNGGALLIKLICCVKNSDWGIIGRESTVARLYYRNARIGIDQDHPYAEFWMGTHESGPSYVRGGEGGGKVTLKEWIERNPSVLGDTVLKKWGTDFPFLFKVCLLCFNIFRFSELIWVGIFKSYTKSILYVAHFIYFES